MTRSDETRHRPEGHSTGYASLRRQPLHSATNMRPREVPAAGELFIDFHMAGIGSRSGGKVDSGGSVRQRRDFPFLAEV